MSEAGPQVNGPTSPTGKFIDGIDPDDPEYIKNLQRPAEVKEDLQQMENRSRVSLVLNSQAFKEELEQVVEEQLRSGPYPASLLALQQITDLLLPHSRGSLSSLARASAVIPINDLRGVESLGFAKGEKLLRCKLAALYRIIDLCGWSHGIYNHISARVSPEHEHFLLNPFGVMYSEITASSLIKVDVRGDIVEPGSTQFGVNRAGFTLHSAIHQARPDIKCIVHLHTPAAVAVSAMKCGLLPMSQEALICGKVSYHDYSGIFIDPDEREKLARNLGVHNKVMVLRNHGLVACGETIEEAFHFTFNVMAACEAQVSAIPAGLDNIVIPSEEAREQAYKVANQGGGGVEVTGRKWRTGELEFEALMRTLDNSGYRTGYVYKMPVVKQEKKDRSNSDVEIPPASSSFTYIFDGDYEHSKYSSPIKAAMERQKKAYKAGWLTTPNAYKKTEVEEIGTTTPKKITKWVPEGDSPNRPGGTPIKLEHPNQFAPQGENPREFKQKQKSIKKDYYEEKVTAGPQSKILEGISWDEAQRAKDGQLSGAGDQLIVVGAASKGIIQRDHQHNAVVYRQYYAANPFENMSEAEIEQYQAEVQRRERGEPEEPTLETSNTVPTSQQPPEAEKPRAAEPPREVERPKESQRDTEVRRSRPQEDNNQLLEGSRSSSSYQEPQAPKEDKLLGQLADKVVQTVISDALSVARRGKGQQTLTGTEPLQQHLHEMGGRISYDKTNKARCSSPILEDSYIRLVEMRNSHGASSSQSDQSSDRGKKLSQEQDRCEDAAGASTEEMGWCEAGASNPEDYITLQLDPIQLYHGQSEGGSIKVKFTIQSTVRRRFRADYNRGGLIEGIYASVSEPIIDHIDCSSVGGPELAVGNSLCVDQLRFITRKRGKHKWCEAVNPEEFRSEVTGALPELDPFEQNVSAIKQYSQKQSLGHEKTPIIMEAAGGDQRRKGNESSKAKNNQAENNSKSSRTVQTENSSCSSDFPIQAMNSSSLNLTLSSYKNTSQELKENDLMFADEGWDEDVLQQAVQQTIAKKSIPQPGRLTTSKYKNRHSQKRTLKRKIKIIGPPLSPVKEETHETNREKMTVIGEELNDSFDHLLSTVGNLNSPNGPLNLKDFIGAVPIACQEDYDTQSDGWTCREETEREPTLSLHEQYNSGLTNLKQKPFTGKSSHMIDKIDSNMGSGNEELENVCQLNSNLETELNNIHTVGLFEEKYFPEERVSDTADTLLDAFSMKGILSVLSHDDYCIAKEYQGKTEATVELSSKETTFSAMKAKDFIKNERLLKEVEPVLPSENLISNLKASDLETKETFLDEVVSYLPKENLSDDESIDQRKETLIDKITDHLEKKETLIDDVSTNHLEKKETLIDDVSYNHLEKKETLIDGVSYNHLEKKETLIDGVSYNHLEKKETLIDGVSYNHLEKKETLIDGVSYNHLEKKETLPKETLIDDIQSIQSKLRGGKLAQPNISHLDEGPIQTSSPKLGRSLSSKGSPFKDYPKKLGKSEETLLDIMPLNYHSAKVVAKSQEELEEIRDDIYLKKSLSRTVSLGPHHKKKKTSSISAKRNAKSKETIIDDAITGSSSKEKMSPSQFVLDRFNLMLHNDMMSSTSSRSVFRAPPIVAYPITSISMPPLPDTTDVPSISDTESHQRTQRSNNPPRAVGNNPRPNTSPTFKQGRSRHSSEDGPDGAAGDRLTKKRWAPKQKRDRRKPSQGSEGDYDREDETSQRGHERETIPEEILRRNRKHERDADKRYSDERGKDEDETERRKEYRLGKDSQARKSADEENVIPRNDDGEKGQQFFKNRREKDHREYARKNYDEEEHYRSDDRSERQTDRGRESRPYEKKERYERRQDDNGSDRKRSDRRRSEKIDSLQDERLDRDDKGSRKDERSDRGDRGSKRQDEERSDRRRRNENVDQRDLREGRNYSRREGASEDLADRRRGESLERSDKRQSQEKMERKERSNREEDWEEVTDQRINEAKSYRRQDERDKRSRGHDRGLEIVKSIAEGATKKERKERASHNSDWREQIPLEETFIQLEEDFIPRVRRPLSESKGKVYVKQRENHDVIRTSNELQHPPEQIIRDQSHDVKEVKPRIQVTDDCFNGNDTNKRRNEPEDESVRNDPVKFRAKRNDREKNEEDDNVADDGVGRRGSGDRSRKSDVDRKNYDRDRTHTDRSLHLSNIEKQGSEEALVQNKLTDKDDAPYHQLRQDERRRRKENRDEDDDSRVSGRLEKKADKEEEREDKRAHYSERRRDQKMLRDDESLRWTERDKEEQFSPNLSSKGKDELEQYSPSHVHKLSPSDSFIRKAAEKDPLLDELKMSLSVRKRGLGKRSQSESGMPKDKVQEKQRASEGYKLPPEGAAFQRIEHLSTKAEDSTSNLKQSESSSSTEELPPIPPRELLFSEVPSSVDTVKLNKVESDGVGDAKIRHNASKRQSKQQLPDDNEARSYSPAKGKSEIRDSVSSHTKYAQENEQEEFDRKNQKNVSKLKSRSYEKTEDYPEYKGKDERKGQSKINKEKVADDMEYNDNNDDKEKSERRATSKTERRIFNKNEDHPDLTKRPQRMESTSRSEEDIPVDKKEKPERRERREGPISKGRSYDKNENYPDHKREMRRESPSRSLENAPVDHRSHERGRQTTLEIKERRDVPRPRERISKIEDQSEYKRKDEKGTDGRRNSDLLREPKTFEIPELREKRGEKRELEPYLYARGRRSGRIPKRLDISREDTPNEESENEVQKLDLDTLIPDNPIELTMDDNNNSSSGAREEETPTPAKKSIFNLFSCVGGKSSEGFKKKSKSKNPSNAYYDEGEKRKIKKLTSKEKEKDEKTKLYFHETEGPVIPEDKIESNEDEFKLTAPELPMVSHLESEPRGRRYQKKLNPPETSKSILIEPSEVSDILGADFDEDVDELPLGTFKRWHDDRVEEPKLSSFMSEKRAENKFNSFRSFGRRPLRLNEVPQNHQREIQEDDHLEEGDKSEDFSIDYSFMTDDVDGALDSVNIDPSIVNNEPIKLLGGCPDPSAYMNDSAEDHFFIPAPVTKIKKSQSSFLSSKASRERPDAQISYGKRAPEIDQDFQIKSKDLRSLQNVDMVGVENAPAQPLLISVDLNDMDGGQPLSQTSAQETLLEAQNAHSIEITLEPPTPETTLDDILLVHYDDTLKHNAGKTGELINSDDLQFPPPPDELDLSYNHPAYLLNTSAPAHFDVDKLEQHVHKNNLEPNYDPQGELNDSYLFNNSFDPSFESPDMLYRRKHRTVSFDERLTLGQHLQVDEHRPSGSSLIAEPITRPRSSSTTSNPLTYEPWRVKAYNKHNRSLSVSDMIHGRGGSRPRKSQSIGEIFNSTVASSVARRRARTLASSDITSRMYQPRQRSRSRALLGDASFGSVAPIRQRSFSGFDHATSAGSVEPTSVSVKRSESERHPSKNQQQVVEEVERKNERSKSDRRQLQKELGDAKPASPSKSDTMRSTDSASGGETLEDRSSKEGSPTKEHPSPTKEKKKKKKFRIPSFSKKKSKENKESAI